MADAYKEFVVEVSLYVRARSLAEAEKKARAFLPGVTEAIGWSVDSGHPLKDEEPQS